MDNSYNADQVIAFIHDRMDIMNLSEGDKKLFMRSVMAHEDARTDIIGVVARLSQSTRQDFEDFISQKTRSKPKPKKKPNLTRDKSQSLLPHQQMTSDRIKVDPQVLGAFTRSAMTQKCMSRSDFAYYLGTSVETLKRMSTGKSVSVEGRVARKLVDVFNASITALSTFDINDEIILSNNNIARFLSDRINRKNIETIANKLGFSETTLKRAISGETTPNCQTLKALCIYFDTTPFDIANYGRPEGQKTRYPGQTV